MKTKVGARIKVSLLIFLLNTILVFDSFTQEIPLAYDFENTGVDCTKPPLPAFADLPIVMPLTDPFEWSDGNGRISSFEDWCCRRAEIGAEIEHYEIGPKPVRPDTITASYSGGTLTVNVTENGKTLTLTSQVTIPEGTGPFPAVIGMNSGTGGLPVDIFSNRKIATIAYMHDQVVTYNNKSKTDPYFKLYPDLFYSGEYAPWAWGVSRIIDGLELVQSDLPIDLKHLAVTGCSYAGKMAIFAGAFDERIALTISQESGGGGAAAWRVSETIGVVETLGATSHQWFMESMFQFSGTNVSKLPHDHHELMAMIAPRAILVLGNPDYIWLADESGYVSCKAAHEVWKAFGIPDRFGFSIVAGHMHCSLPNTQYPEVEAYVEKFLLGDTTVNTNVMISPYDIVDFSRWTRWWGTGDPAFPARDEGGSESVWFEPECSTIGKNWNILSYNFASNNCYVTVKSGLNSTSEAPTDSASAIFFPFKVNTDTTFYVFARSNCPSVNDDSYWIKMDDGEFVLCNGLVTSGYQWRKLASYKLNKGEHTFTIAYSEDGARLDKICISSYPYVPTAMGDTAENICVPEISTIGVKLIEENDDYNLEQNYPNPFNGNTSIAFEIPRNTYVSLKVFSIQGIEIEELAGKEYTAGRNSIEFTPGNLTSGIYFYRIKTDEFTMSRKMILKAE